MSDRLQALREELAELEEVPVADRVERFERANELLAAELAALDELAGG